MARRAAFKKFPVPWRSKWLELFQESPTAAGVWAYMWWRSDKDDIFNLEESLVCEDLKLNRKTLCAARTLIAKRGGFVRVCERNAKGQLMVKYRMRGFADEANSVPKSGTEAGESQSRNLGLEPSPDLRDSVNGYHTVDVVSVTLEPSAPAIPEPMMTVDSTPVSKQASRQVGGANAPLPDAHTTITELPPRPAMAMTDNQHEQRLEEALEAIVYPGGFDTVFGLPYLTDEHREPAREATEWALLYCGNVEPFHWATGCAVWALQHKFWSRRVVNLATFAKALSRQDEKGLAAQYNRALAAEASKAQKKYADAQR